MKTKTIIIIVLALLVVLFSLLFMTSKRKNQSSGNFYTISTHNYYKKSSHKMPKAISNHQNIETIFYKSRNLLDFIYNINRLQPIRNKNFEEDFKLVILIQVHNRTEYLTETVNSLREASEINSTLLIFSHDIYDENINRIINQIDFAPVMQIFYPFSIQTHPITFPGTDPEDCVSLDDCQNVTCSCPNFKLRDGYNNFRNASVAQIKHHWWWKLNFAFDKITILKDYNGLFLFLEDDHYVAPDFIYCLNSLVRYQEHICPNCWFYALGLHDRYNFDLLSDYFYMQKNVQNLGLAFNRTIFKEISKYREHFCTYDDYNWDWSLRYVILKVIPEEIQTLVLAATRALHIGYCGAHSRDKDCNPSDLIQYYKKQQIGLFPKYLTRLENVEELVFSVNGGWGDPRDHALCMAM